MLQNLANSRRTAILTGAAALGMAAASVMLPQMTAAQSGTHLAFKAQSASWPIAKEAGKSTDTAHSAKASASVQAGSFQYSIGSSCNPWKGDIQRGASYWGNAQEVSYPGGWHVDCSTNLASCDLAHGPIGGCNVLQQQHIFLNPWNYYVARDVALVAAHEFGHIWYPNHTPGVRCSTWGTPAQVMGPGSCP